MLTAKEAKVLATKVVKESSNVTVKIGSTNGEFVLHLNNKAERKSDTIAELWQWSEHEWNKHAV